MLRGAPYAAIGNQRLQTMLKLTNVEKTNKAVDLGSGDGRIVIALAKHGAEAHGYELNPVVYLFSKFNVYKSGLSNAHIHWGDYWTKNLSEYNLVTLYGTTHIMGNLEKKLRKELRPGARIISNHFQFPHWKPKKIKDDVYLYIR